MESLEPRLLLSASIEYRPILSDGSAGTPITAQVMGPVLDYAAQQRALMGMSLSSLSYDLFLKLSGITGESQDAKHYNEIDVLSFGWGGDAVINSGVEKLQELHVVSRTSKASPQILSAMKNGTILTSATLTGRDAGKSAYEFYTLNLDQVRISSYQQSLDATGYLVEEFTLNFAGVLLNYRPINIDGTLGTAVTFQASEVAVENYSPTQKSLFDSTGGASGLFLNLSGIPGESMDSKHMGQIDVMSFGWGGDWSASSGTSFQELHILSRTSKASPLILDAMNKGTLLSSATLAVVHAGASSEIEIYTLHLSDVRISSYQMTTASGSFLEEFTLSFVIRPAATPVTVTTAEDSTKSITLAGTGGVGNPLTATIVSLPSLGTLYQTPDGVTLGAAITLAGTGVTNPNGAVIFKPASNGNGAPYASFQFSVSDGITTSAAATVTVNVTAVNDAPVPTNDTLSSVYENSGTRYIPFSLLLGNDSPGPSNESGQTLTIIAVGKADGGTVSISGINVLFAPDPGYNGPASFAYTVRDNGTTNGLSDPRTAQANVSFTIAPSDGEISGIKWNDLNGNGVREAGEPGLAGWMIYLDTNNNGGLDAGEPTQLTGAEGRYVFRRLAPGGYTVREVAQTGWTQTSPGSGGRLFILEVLERKATISEIDPVDGNVLNSFDAPAEVTFAGPQGLALGPTSLFYIDGSGEDPHTLYELDPNTGAVIDADVVDPSEPAEIAGLAFIRGHVIIELNKTDELLVWDPIADKLADALYVKEDVRGGLAGGADQDVLFESGTSGLIFILNPADGSIRGALQAEVTASGGLAYVNGEIVAAAVTNQEFAFRIHARTGEIIDRIPLPGRGVVCALGGDGLTGNAFSVYLSPGQSVSGRDLGDRLTGIYGTGGNDTIRLMRKGALSDVSIGGTYLCSFDAAYTPAMGIFGVGGDDVLILDMSGGAVGQVNWDGGAHLVSGDTLRIIGAATGTDTAVVNGTTMTFNGKTIGAFNTERLSIDFVGGDNLLTILAGRVTFESTQTLKTLAISGTGKLDLLDTDLVIGISTLAETQSLIRSGYNSGAWDGAGIVTSSAVAGKHGLGYRVNGDGSIFVKFTFLGDADLDGDVDASDVAKWALNFTGELSGVNATKTWTQGDWDFDGDVDASDVAKWALNFTGELSGGGLTHEAEPAVPLSSQQSDSVAPALRSEEQSDPLEAIAPSYQQPPAATATGEVPSTAASRSDASESPRGVCSPVAGRVPIRAERDVPPRRANSSYAPTASTKRFWFATGPITASPGRLPSGDFSSLWADDSNLLLSRGSARLF